MDYYGLLFLYYLKGLSGKSILRLFFNIEVGGTEQLLPENTSAPTTTPILADIQYPDEFRTDQYFTYRETPTTISNKARIKTIKGNTLVWNQLVENGNFADTSFWGSYAYRFTFSVASNKGTFVTNGSDPQIRFPIVITSGHKYLFMAKMENGANVVSTYIRAFQDFATSQVIVPLGTALGQFNYVFTASNNFNIIDIRGYRTNNQTLQTDDSFILSNVMLIDLTQMGLDISNPSDFTSLFPLPYYSYNQGTLLSFNGSGIKTTGKNLCPKFTNGTGGNLTYTVGDDGSVKVTGTNTGTDFYAIPFTLPAGTYVLSGAPTNGQLTIRNAQGGSAPSSEFSGQLDDYGNGATFTVSSTATAWLNIRSTARTHDDTYYPMIRRADADNTYEPYTSSTTSLPISTYFPTGMKSAGSVYDELTPSKAITRIGTVDLGSLTWRHRSEVKTSLFSATMPDYKKQLDTPSICARYGYIGTVYGVSGDAGASGRLSDKQYALFYQVASNDKVIYLYDTSFTTVDSLTSSLSGVYLYYELATETETPIEPATEDANEALSLLMGKSVSSNNANQLIDIITKGE